MKGNEDLNTAGAQSYQRHYLPGSSADHGLRCALQEGVNNNIDRYYYQLNRSNQMK